MNDNLEYFKRNPIYRQYHHNEISFSLTYAFTENFLLLFSHDEVVHGKGALLAKMPGDDWQQFANLRLLYAWQFLHPGSQLLFMGSEFGQRAEWDFATELSWEEQPMEAHQGVQRLVSALNQLYREKEALYRQQYEAAGFDWIAYDDHENSVLTFVRHSGKAKPLIAVLNFTPRPLENYRIGVPQAGPYRLILNGDDPHFWGSDAPVEKAPTSDTTASHGREQSLLLQLPPLAALVYQPE